MRFVVIRGFFSNPSKLSIDTDPNNIDNSESLKCLTVNLFLKLSKKMEVHIKNLVLVLARVPGMPSL